LVQRTDGVSYCYPIDDTLKCSQFDQDSFQKGFLKCATCKTNNFVISTDTQDFFNTHCMSFFEVANCVSYDINPIVADSAFSCTKCTNNFFLDVASGECKVRTIQLPTCKEYQVKLDQCKVCQEGYYLNGDGQSCVSYPVGTKLCRSYRRLASGMQCLGCITGFYLENSYECKSLDEAQKVAECLYHVSPGTCETCNTGFLLVNNECKKIVAKNCKDLENINSCRNCKVGYGFVETNGVKNCEQ